MIDEEYNFILEDRLAKIRAINEQYNLEENAFLSFSGGKDTMVVHKLIDLALPGNKIPRVYLNTGIEYQLIRKFVKKLSESDSRIVMLNPKVNIKKTLTENGYPFKSKEFAQKLMIYQNNQDSVDSVLKEYREHPERRDELLFSDKAGMGVVSYLLGLTINKTQHKINNSPQFKCPDRLSYLFSNDENKTTVKISDRCCYFMKEKPLLDWSRENNRGTTILGLMRAEGGRRALSQCTVFDKNDKLRRFSPLAVVSKEWEEEFIKRNNVELSPIYYPPYNFPRTGCKGCPFALNLQEQLTTLYKLLPSEYKQCLILWKPIYDEYIRIGYRLEQYPHLCAKKKSLF